MSLKVLFVHPWNYHDHGEKYHDSSKEWRHAPYSSVLLATLLLSQDIDVNIIDLECLLVSKRGDLDDCLLLLEREIAVNKPDIIGVSFFSVHYKVVEQICSFARSVCKKHGLEPAFIAGGIHATVEPQSVIEGLGFDYAFLGEAELSLERFLNGEESDSIPGVCSGKIDYKKGDVIQDLDLLPFPDWSLCDYKFYSRRSSARTKLWHVRSLDLIASRGCSHRCSFCAYGALSKVRFHSSEYLIEQMLEMVRRYNVDCLYFADSSIGNSRRRLVDLCEKIIKEPKLDKVEWHANIRTDQVDKDLLALMYAAGCRYLFYGFESGSQRILDAMSKGTRVEQSVNVSKWHYELGFPYHASIVVGYPGEREDDLSMSHDLLKATKPPSIGVNHYVPLPGSIDYTKLKQEGAINVNDPDVWRRVGEVNSGCLYADIERSKYELMVKDITEEAYARIPGQVSADWVKKIHRAGFKRGNILKQVSWMFNRTKS